MAKKKMTLKEKKRIFSAASNHFVFIIWFDRFARIGNTATMYVFVTYLKKKRKKKVVM